MTWNKFISRELVDITTTSQIDIVFIDYAWEFLKEKREVLFTLMKDQVITHYIDFDKRDYWRYVFNKLFKSSDDIKRYYEEGLILIENLEKINKKRNIKILFKEYRDQFKIINYNYSIGTWCAIEGWQADFDEMLVEMIRRNKLEDEQEKIINSIYKPWKKTSLVEIQEKVRGGADIKKLVEEYQFLRNWSAVWYRPLTKEWFDNFTPVEKGEDIGENMEEYSSEELKRMLKPDEKELHYLEFAPYLIFFKDWRDDLRRMQCYKWGFLFERIAEEYGLELFDLGYLTLDEIEEGLEANSFDKETIEIRKNNPIIVTIIGDELKIKVIDREIPKRYFDIIEKTENSNEKKIVKGLSAQHGIVKGRARIVKSFHDIKRVAKGDILIANTTHPNYVPAMRTALAFVTNEGGMACHAAIVARELKKPCVVGTKIATKVFKDGDIVEVDANKGIVRLAGVKK